MNLILIRHGQSEWNALNQFTGWKDPGLTSKGVEEARNAGKIINNLKINFDLVFTSALIRAQNTAEIILKEINRDVSIFTTLPGNSLKISRGSIYCDLF